MALFNFPFHLFGGALRPDAISGLTSPFRKRLTDMFNAAPASVQKELGLTSAYRSPAVQAALYRASHGSGMVGRPYRSRHNFGDAADLYGFGMGGRGAQVSPETADWVHQHAGDFGLYFPMMDPKRHPYEPWHIQLMRSTGMAGPGPQPGVALGTTPTPTDRPADQPAPDGSPLFGPPDQTTQDDRKDKMQGLLDQMMKPPEPMGDVPNLLGQGGGSGVMSLPEYIAQFMALRRGGGGGMGGMGQGGQGFG